MASTPSKASVWARVQVGGVERVVEVTEDAMVTPVPFFVDIARELGADAEELRLTYLDDEGDWYVCGGVEGCGANAAAPRAYAVRLCCSA